MVDLPSGKMKSREGTVVDADDLIAEMVATARQKNGSAWKSDELLRRRKRQFILPDRNGSA